jgi:hypothetical protein
MDHANNLNMELRAYIFFGIPAFFSTFWFVFSVIHIYVHLSYGSDKQF